MLPFVAAQVRGLVESIRLLEAYVIAPLGLHADIKMLRQAMPFPEASDLPVGELSANRLGLARLTQDRARTALDAVSLVRAALLVLGRVSEAERPPLGAEWMARAGRVLARIEQRVGDDLRARTAARVKGLYVIVDPEATDGRPVLEVAEACLRGGAGVLQLRDKNGDKGPVLRVATDLRTLCDEHEALFIMNDDADLALAGSAHGLHVGQADLPVAAARRVLDPGQIVGRSNNSLEEATESHAQGADYLAVGAVFATRTMGKGARRVVGPDLVRRVKQAIARPVVAIGGIDAENVGEVVRAGADCVCVVSAVTMAPDPEGAARRIVEAIGAASG